MSTPTNRTEEGLFNRVTEIIVAARSHVARSVNTAMVHAYWLIGREIVEVEQRGKQRAGYGDAVVARLARRLTERFRVGYTSTSIKRMRQFYLAFPNGSLLPLDLGGPGRGPAVRDLVAGRPGTSSPQGTVGSTRPREDANGLGSLRLSPHPKGAALLHQFAAGREVMFPPLLGWTHYLFLTRVENPTARAFYEIEAAREEWSSRELERQIASLLFERLAKSRDPRQVLALAKRGQEVTTPQDILKDPFVLEFVGLPERRTWLERDLEQAIMDHLGDFLLEAGKGFCYVARQKRITLEGDHFYVDLVFYNRLLRCFVLVDLKLGKLTHQDLGQMMMYVNWFDRFQRAEHEQPTVGIVLCSDKNDAVVRITLPEGNSRILAARYQACLPTEEELRALVTRRRAEVELRLRQEEADRR
jgi:predicted nuclease of restriction endonuclease-like (RecB) superfamily